LVSGLWYYDTAFFLNHGEILATSVTRARSPKQRPLRNNAVCCPAPSGEFPLINQRQARKEPPDRQPAKDTKPKGFPI
jgi:hypothetical protein